MHGEGYLRLPDQYSYTGRFLSGLFNGKGEMHAADKSHVFRGIFSRGKWENGVVEYADGTCA